MNLEKAVNHGNTADTAKSQKPVFAFASRCVAVSLCRCGEWF
jgi:hypothetical protein